MECGPAAVPGYRCAAKPGVCCWTRSALKRVHGAYAGPSCDTFVQAMEHAQSGGAQTLALPGACQSITKIIQVTLKKRAKGRLFCRCRRGDVVRILRPFDQPWVGAVDLLQWLRRIDDVVDEKRQLAGNSWIAMLAPWRRQR